MRKRCTACRASSRLAGSWPEAQGWDRQQHGGVGEPYHLKDQGRHVLYAGGNVFAGARGSLCHPGSSAFSNVRPRAVQVDSSPAKAEELQNVIIRLRGLPRPVAPPRCSECRTFASREEALAALKAANNICSCTCRIGEPSFLCRAYHCYASEVGTCEPTLQYGHWCDDISTWPDFQWRAGWRVKNCRCINWDLITDNGQLTDQCDNDVRYASSFDNVWGEHDEFCCTERWRGDHRTAVRIWPPPRARSCDHCSGFGTYVRTCTSDDCMRAARGRSILVIGDDVAVACAIKCSGHGSYTALPAPGAHVDWRLFPTS